MLRTISNELTALYKTHKWHVGWLEINVPFPHKYGYIRDESWWQWLRCDMKVIRRRSITCRSTNWSKTPSSIRSSPRNATDTRRQLVSKSDVTPATESRDFDTVARVKVASVTGRVASCVVARRTVARLVFGIERCSILLCSILCNFHAKEARQNRRCDIGLMVVHVTENGRWFFLRCLSGDSAVYAAKTCLCVCRSVIVHCVKTAKLTSIIQIQI